MTATTMLQRKSGNTEIVSRLTIPCALLRLSLLIAVSLTMVSTLAPFDFGLAHISEGQFLEVLRVPPANEALKTLGHFGAFFAIGALVALNHPKIQDRIHSRGVVAIAVVLCAVVESGQLALPGRHARLIDLIANAAGLCAGFILTARLGRGLLGATQSRWGSSQRAKHVAAALAISSCVVWGVASLYATLHAGTLGWDRSFHLLLGNEVDASEPWIGELGFARIYSGALTPIEVGARYRSSSTRENDPMLTGVDLLVGYDFTVSAREVAVSGRCASDAFAMDIPPQAQRLSATGPLALREPAMLISRGSVGSLVDAITSAGAFTVELSLRSLLSEQHGPARIISNSENIWTRNFMLGQEGADLIFRVRNGVNGENGLRHALRVPRALDTETHHLVAIYDHGVSQIFRDGEACGPVVDLRDPALHLRLGSGWGARGATGLLFALMVAIPVGLAIPASFSKPTMHCSAICCAIFACLVPYLLSCASVGGPWRLGVLLASAAAFGPAYVAGVAYVRRPGIGITALTQP